MNADSNYNLVVNILNSSLVEHSRSSFSVDTQGRDDRLKIGSVVLYERGKI